MNKTSVKALDRRLCVAPMMDWTDRHCRYFHRLFAPDALLYTEMITAAAIVRGDAARLLEFDALEHPVALQLGGSDPAQLALAARIGAAAGYDEINLNVGCPSERVKTGEFGACLMLRPAHVADCIRVMRAEVNVPVTVKCRIGVDDQDSYEFFSAFVDQVTAAGVAALIVHARAAVLGGLGKPGLTPKENREIPPLKYEYVHRLKTVRDDLSIVINGGISDLSSIMTQARSGLGVMLGRAAYHDPTLLARAQQALIDERWRVPQPAQILERMRVYARREADRGTRLHSITRHMHGLLAGRTGARAWRRFLSEFASKADSHPDILTAALPLLDRTLAA